MYAPIGSISCGTLVTTELASSIAYTIESLARRDTDEGRRADANALLAQYHEDEAAGDEAGLQEFVNEKAPEMLDRYCAPYTSFRAHEGDGADFGIFPDISSLEEDARFEDGVIKVNAGDEWPELDDDIHYVMEVTDHGNVSLYDRSKQELWSCV